MNAESNLTRITVNLRPRGMAALESLMSHVGGKTDAVERSLVAYAYLSKRVAEGAELRLRHPDGVVEAVTFL